MNIAVVGAGNVGRALGMAWRNQGHTVYFGVRDRTSDKVKQLDVGKATILTIKEAVSASEVAVLAVPGQAVSAIIEDLGSALDHKIIIDAANNLKEDVMHSFERMRQLAPQAKLYRAFNSLGWENFETPSLGGVRIDHFYCGDDGESQAIVHALITDIGLKPIYLGGLEHSSTLDALTRLWFTLAYQQGYGRRVALKVIAEDDIPDGDSA